MMRRLYPLLFFAALMVLAFWKPLFHPEFTLLAGADMCAQTYPWFNVAAYWLKKGVFLLWDPYVYSGKANLGELQTGMLYPLNWLFMLIPAKGGGINLNGLQLLLILHYFLMACFCFLLARSLGLQKYGAAAAGVIFALAGYVGQLFGWVNIFGGFVWMPLVFCFFRRALLADNSRARWRGLLWGALFIALSFLAGHHAAAIHTGLLLFFFTLYRFICNWGLLDWRKKMLSLAALAGITVTAGLLTAVQWLPSWEWAHYVWRWVGDGEPVRWGQKIPYSVLEGSGNVNPQDMISLLLPYLSTGSNLYLGASVLFLALVGILFARGSDARFFGIAAFLYLFLSWGRFSALHGWVNTFIPGVWFAREAYLYLVPLQMCLALLAGWGLDYLVESYSGTPQRSLALFIRRAGWGMAFLSAGIGALMVAVHILKSVSWNHPYLRSLASLAVYLTILGLLLFLLHTGRIRPRVFALLLFAVTFLDIASQHSSNTFTVDRGKEKDNAAMQAYWKIHPAGIFLKELRQKEVFRVDNPSQVFPENFGDAWLLESTMGHGATGLVDYLDFRGTGWGPTSNATALLNARYFVSRVPVPRMKKVYGEAEAVYLNPRAVPRAFVAPRYHSFSEGKEILTWIRTPLFAPRETVLLRRVDLTQLQPQFLEQAVKEDEELWMEVISSWRAAERDAGRITDEEALQRATTFHAPWGWSVGDEVTLRLRPANPMQHSYLVLNYMPTSGQSSRLRVRRERSGQTEEVPVELPGLEPGEAESDLPKQKVIDLGALGKEQYLVAFTRTEECSANIDSLRITSSMPGPGDSEAGEVRITSFKPNQIKLLAELKRPAFVVVSEVFYPGWQALVDNKPTPLLAGDFILRAVPVPAGRHEIVLRFRSQTFQWGLAISLITLSGMILALVLTRKKKHQADSETMANNA